MFMHARGVSSRRNTGVGNSKQKIVVWSNSISAAIEVDLVAWEGETEQRRRPSCVGANKVELGATSIYGLFLF